MIDLIFLKALRDKLKGGNSKSIHLNVLPGRFATRLDLAHLNHIQPSLPRNFLDTLLTQAHFELSISFDGIDLNTISTEEQKHLGLLSKRLNSMAIENEDNYKEHGIKTFGFGFPILIKASKADPAKIIKAPLFVWQLEIIKSTKKVNTWSILRNKVKQENGRIADEEVHSVNLNEVLLSFLKADEGVAIPQINEELLEDALIDKQELFDECYKVIKSLNANTSPQVKDYLRTKYEEPLSSIPDAAYFDSISNNDAHIYFGGVFGLFKTQKESIITDIDKLIEKFDQYNFENLKSPDLAGSPFSSIDTDPSQQEILNTLDLQPKKIIQGPPGTGKSQSLTALITNALSNNLKCLVVCEKKTALEVIKNNLIRENPHLGNLAAVIEDIGKDRDSIVNSVRDRINNSDQIPYFNDKVYSTLQDEVMTSAQTINGQHKLLDKKIYQGRNWTELVGQFLKRRRYTDYNVLQDKLDYKWFAFTTDENEMEQISTSLKNAKRYYGPVNTLNHPLLVLHNDVFHSNNLSATQLKLENLTKTYLSTFPAVEQAITEHQRVTLEWKIGEYPNYAAYTKTIIGKWISYILGEINPEFTSLQPILDQLESAKKYAYDSEQFILIVEQAISEYRQWLHQHYYDYQNELENRIKIYQDFINENNKIYGPVFLKNTPLNKLIANVLGVFSGKYKTLKSNRLEVANGVSDIKNKHLSHDYINHLYINTSNQPDLNVFVMNIEELKLKCDIWKQTVPSTIKDWLNHMDSSKLHPDYENVRFVADVERNSTLFIQELNTKFELFSSSSNFNSLHDIVSALTSYKKLLSVISRNLENFISIYEVQHISYLSVLNKIAHISRPFNSENIFNERLTDDGSLDDHLTKLQGLKIKSLLVNENLEEFRAYYYWRTYFNSQPMLYQKIITSVIESRCDQWDTTFECWYLQWLLSSHDSRDLPNNENNIKEFIKSKNELRDSQIDGILYNWKKRQTNSLKRMASAGISPSNLFNKRGSKGEKRHSIRKIIKTDFELFTDFYPVVMVSPSVCSSIVPLQEGIFDLVIFDEASQLRLEDTFPALLRGKIRLVSGDSQQMPPSSYFQGGNALLTPTEDEPEEKEESLEKPSLGKMYNSLDLAESESLLVYAENSNYKQSYLKIHYRSQHPHLIDFSNHAFYGKRLIPMPFKKDYKCIEFIEVNGLYEDQVNRDEARQVVDILIHHIKPLQNGKYPSVGIATFNLYQRNLILEEIIKVRQQSDVNDKKLNDLGSDLFVKNLENIQGDERDIIIISTTFGRKADGTFSQHFGPIIQSKGYKLLNVLITRAKIKIFLCTSIPFESIRTYGNLLQIQRNNGRAIFYTYLAYAKAVSDRNEEQVHSILQQLYDNCDAKVFNIEHDVLGSESPFEEEVYYRLSEKIGQNRIQQQYRLGGFRIDLIINSERTGQPFIAIECDGAKYHSSNEAYSWDMFRQTQLENYGFIFYRIWSTSWWHSTEKELKTLVEFIHAQDQKERNAGNENFQEILPEENIIPITAQQKSKAKVVSTSVVTLKGADGKIFKIKFSRDEQNLKKVDEQGVKINYERSPLAIALYGRTEGEICQLGMLEVYYEIMKIE